MNIIDYSIKNRTVTLFLTFVIIVGGIFSYMKLGKLEDPEFRVKEAIVVTLYPQLSVQQQRLPIPKWQLLSPLPEHHQPDITYPPVNRHRQPSRRHRQNQSNRDNHIHRNSPEEALRSPWQSADLHTQQTS